MLRLSGDGLKPSKPEPIDLCARNKSEGNKACWSMYGYKIDRGPPETAVQTGAARTSM